MGETLVVGWDGSAGARSALATAAAFARGGRVVVVHVREARHPQTSARWQELAELDADSRSQALLAEAARQRPGLEECELELRSADGDPAKALLAIADEVDAQAIVVGSRGLGEAAAIVGSVSDALLRDARRPVLVAAARPTTATRAA